MLLVRRKPNEGTWFAWHPVWTEDGTVWLERVRYYWSDAEFGGYIYSRLRSEIDAA